MFHDLKAHSKGIVKTVMDLLNPTDYPTMSSQLALYQKYGCTPSNAFLKASTSHRTNAERAIVEANSMIVKQVFGSSKMVFDDDELVCCHIGPWAIPECGPHCEQTKKNVAMENSKRPQIKNHGLHLHEQCDHCSHQGELQLAEELCTKGTHLTACCYK